MCLALRASGLWQRYAALQNLPPRPPPWRNPRKGRDQILPSGNLGQGARGECHRLRQAGEQARQVPLAGGDNADGGRRRLSVFRQGVHGRQTHLDVQVGIATILSVPTI